MHEINSNRQAFEKLLDQEANKYSKFVRDGIVDYDIFLRQPVKILWILKETNDPSGSCTDLRRFLDAPDSYPGWKRTWLPVLQVSTALLSNGEDVEPESFESIDSKIKLSSQEFFPFLRRIAVINISKLPGDKSISPRELITRYNQFRDFTLSQIKLINPDVIICCGVFWVMWKDLENYRIDGNEPTYFRKALDENTDRTKGKIKAHYNPQRIFVETYHPNQRIISRRLYFESIVRSVGAWSKSERLV